MELSPTAAEVDFSPSGTPVTLAERLVVVQRDLAIALAATSDMQAALSLLLDYALIIDELDCGGIYLSDRVTGGFRLAVHRGLSEVFVEAVGILAGDSHHARLVRAGRPMYFAGPDVAEHDPPCVPEGIRAVAAVPLCDGGEVIACVNLGSHTQDEIPLLARQWIEGITMQFGGVIARIKAQQELAHRTRELESLANHVPDVIFRLDARLCYVFANERMVEITGVDAADIVGKPCASVGLSQEWSKACVEACLGLLAEAAPTEAQFDTAIAERGCSYQTNLVPEIDPEGKLVGTLGTVRDVTDCRLREDELRITATHYSQLVENCPDAIFVHDGERFLFVNSKAAGLLGLESTEELIGADVWSCVSPAFRKLVRGRVGHLLRTPGATVPIIE
ncbi:MAG: PAS domain-containing protein [Phycisphaerae bacterium]|nr:PAS domain-containing protein [Phycisphaerae bacterium]